MHSLTRDRSGSTGNCSLFVSGDCCPVSHAAQLSLQQTPAPAVLGRLYEIIQNADWSITNLECPLTQSGRKIEKIGPNLRAGPEMAAVLKSAGFDMVTLANNHSHDYGQMGLLDALANLQKNGLAYGGAGGDLSEAQTTFHIAINGVRLAIINVAEVEFSCANASHGGAHAMNLVGDLRRIREVRDHADHVLMIIHGGHEYYQYPSAGMLNRYGFYAESGVSAIIAHHTHCMGAYEVYRGVSICYSLGSFFFSALHKACPTFWHEGYAVLLRLPRSHVGCGVVPYGQWKDGAFVIDGTRSDTLLEELQNISKRLSDVGQIDVAWREFTWRRTEFYLTQIAGVGQWPTRILRRVGGLRFMYRRRQLSVVRQMIRCEAHKEVACVALSDYLDHGETP